jgi:beta-galactosidase
VTWRALLGGLALALCVSGSVCAREPAKLPPLGFGVAWYPEQWPASRWDADLDLMRTADIDIVRIGEFSWSTLEPSEGHYDFAWLDSAIEAAARHGMRVVLGTPTAAPPAWLTARYPDTLRVDEHGVRAEHGGRRQFSFASARYRRFAREIATRMAERYGHNPAVVGWQIDNEIGPPSFDAEARDRFHDWLQRHYGSIGELNRRWTTAYWSQTYDNFGQVPLRGAGQENPGLLLAWRHFVSDTWNDYIANQVDAIRRHSAPRQFVTTNTMHWNAGFDHYALHRQLDFASWDNYIPDGKPDWLDNGAQHDLVRGYLRRNFWVMETQAGHVDWWPVNRALARGQMREMAWQAVGHGADALLYWQWRSALNGQEQYHGVLVGPDDTPMPTFAEAQRIGREFAKAGPALAGTSPHAAVAMLMSYDSRWAIDYQRFNKAFDPLLQFMSFYRPLRQRAQAVDIVSPDAKLDGYALVVAPSLHMLSPVQARHLVDYVRAGGHLVLGPRSGMKDADDALYPRRQPGPFADALGGHVEQFYALDASVAVDGDFGKGQAHIWAESMVADAADTRILERYGDDNGWLAGRAAVLARPLGRGEITYVGAWFDEATQGRLADSLLAAAKVAPLLAGVPDDVEVCERRDGSRRVLILINHAAAARSVSLPAPMRNVLDGTLADGPILLPAHDVGVYSVSSP